MAKFPPQTFPLRQARVHEVCGAGSTGFAAVVCALARGNVLWIRERWQREHLNPLGLAGFFDPGRLLVAQASDQADVLAVAEEALRDGAVPVVLIEVTRPLDLREGRRLQLAAKGGGGLGLCLIPAGMGSNASETRWQAEPVFSPDAGSGDSTLMHWKIIKNKSGTYGAWDVRWDAAAHRLDVVSPVGKRPGAAQTPD